MLGISQLTNGLVLQSIRSNEIKFSATFTQLGDFLFAGFRILDSISDGTNTFLSLELMFSTTITLYSGTKDRVEFTVSDDLSPLISMRALLRGKERTEDDVSGELKESQQDMQIVI